MDLLPPDDPSLVEEVSWVPRSPLPEEPVQVWAGEKISRLWALLLGCSAFLLKIYEIQYVAAIVWSLWRLSR